MVPSFPCVRLSIVTCACKPLASPQIILTHGCILIRKSSHSRIQVRTFKFHNLNNTNMDAMRTPKMGMPLEPFKYTEILPGDRCLDNFILNVVITVGRRTTRWSCTNTKHGGERAETLDYVW